MILLFLFSVALRGVVGDQFDLSNLNWTLKNDNKSIIIPAQIPSQVHLDLFKAGVITDPLIDINGKNHLISSNGFASSLVDRFHTKMDCL